MKTISHRPPWCTTFLLGCFFGFLGVTSFAPNSLAQSYDLTITAKVNAPLPTSPAIITSPGDQEHFTTSTITVSGICGDGAYVIVERNGAQAGMTTCNSGSFSLPVSLVQHANQLQARVYNTTDNEGQVGPAITVYYDIITPSPTFPVETLFQLQVSNVDNVPFAPGIVFRTSTRPVVQGYAQPGSLVTIQYTPGETVCRTTANTQGQWVCMIASELDVGRHEVVVSSLSPQGIISQFPMFSIIVAPTIPTMAAAPSPPLTIAYFPLVYSKIKIGEPWSNNATVLGGTPPYTLAIDWGDKTSDTYKSTNSQPIHFSHRFQKAGTFSPTLRAVDSLGQNTLLQTVVVVTDDNPQKNTSAAIIPSSLYVPLISAIGLVVAASIVIETVVAINAIRGGWPKSKK